MLEKTLYFPTDLVHCVVDYLAGDQEALSNCALVAWDFVHPSRKLLFGNISLRASSDNERPATRLWSLLSTAEHLVPYITSLQVQVDQYGSQAQDATQTDWIREDAALPKVIAGLSNLKEISIESTTSPIKWVDLSPRLHSSFYEAFTRPNLTKLSLILVEDFPINALRVCSNLKHLILRCVSLLDSDTAALLPDLASSLCLENLEIIESRDTFLNLNSWLQNPDIPGIDNSSLKQLSLAVYGSTIRYNKDMSAMSDFIERFSPSLEILRLTPPVMCADIRDITSNPFHLRIIPNLHRLEFSIEISDFDDVESSPALFWLSELFSNLPPANIIQDVILKCEVLQANPLGEFDSRIWVAIDKFLTCKELARLRHVALIIYPIYSAGKTHAPLDTSLLEKEMSILKERNMLQVEKGHVIPKL